jgi:hypothetical protein
MPFKQKTASNFKTIRSVEIVCKKPENKLYSSNSLSTPTARYVNPFNEPFVCCTG